MAVSRWLRPVAIVVAVLSTAVGFGQTKADEPVKTIRITGQVTDRLHEPIVNAAVALKVAPATPPGFSVGFTRAVTTTDLNGRFTFPAVPPGDYILHFESSGFAFLEKSITASKDIELADVVLEVGLLEGPAEPPYNVSPVGQKLDDHVEDTSDTLSVCEVLRDLKHLNGSMVSIRGIFSWSHFHWKPI